MDKITESLQQMLRENELRFQTLFNGLTKDGNTSCVLEMLHDFIEDELF